MNQNDTILITGAAGFIASQMAKLLNQKGFKQLYLVDDFSREDKKENFISLQYIELIDREHIQSFFERNIQIDIVIHLGARTDTTEMDYSIHEHLNLNYSKIMWEYCTKNNVPIIYASSAATYGNGEFGYDDNHEVIEKLVPLNPYGVSKNEFDKFAIKETTTPPNWYGLKFFNVYGPNENHKGRMASVVYHAYHQIKKTGSLKLFRSHNPNYLDGEQMRDFIYVFDLVNVIFWLMKEKPSSGIYNLGSGKAETFLELGNAVFKALELEPKIDFIDTPEDIREKYQYFTEANMQKLIKSGYTETFKNIEEGAIDYVKNYLSKSSSN
jgi:ADP-L-glycero-D-manno-heptose 6-epimerase